MRPDQTEHFPPVKPAPRRRMSRDEETAFPSTETLNSGESFSPGMSLRDYFAAKAMEGMIASSRGIQRADIPEFAYNLADAMLEARENRT